MVGHRPYKNGGNHMAFCPTNDSHRSGCKMLDLAYRLHGYTGSDCPQPDMYNFWDCRACDGQLSINVMEVREFVYTVCENDAGLMSKVDAIEYALFEDVMEILEKGGVVMTLGTQAFNFFKSVSAHSPEDNRRYKSVCKKIVTASIPGAMNVPWCV